MKKIAFLDLKRFHSELENEIELKLKEVFCKYNFIGGEEVSSFEKNFASFSSIKYCVGVGNGLEALFLILKAIEIEKEDEVIVPSNTFIATWLAVSMCGGKPIPVEPDPITYNIDTTKIEALITPKTKAIIPVHLYGRAANMTEINKIADTYGLHIVEDAAQAQGATHSNKPVGSFSIASATSFYPGKNLGAFGDAGAVITDNVKIADKIRMLGNYGSKLKYSHELKGINSRLDEIQAAVLNIKLKHLNKWNQERKDIAQLYGNLIENTLIQLPNCMNDNESVWHLYVIRTKSREQLRNFLYEKNIETGIHYPIPCHMQKCYRGEGYMNLKQTEVMAKEILSLPIYPGITKNEIAYIAESINKFKV